MIKFGDFQCPYCREWALGTGREVKAVYIDSDQVRLVYRHFVIFGSFSRLQAVGTECAGEQGAFWELHDEIYQGGPYDRQMMYQVAERLGLDVAPFRQCIQEDRYAGVVDADISFAQALQVPAVPSFLIQRGNQWVFQRGAAGLNVLGPLLDQFIDP